MADPQSTGQSPAPTAQGKAGSEGISQIGDTDELPNNPQAPKFNESSKPKELSAEEQMALYEKDLKENDWGHQPC